MQQHSGEIILDEVAKCVFSDDTVGGSWTHRVDQADVCVPWHVSLRSRRHGCQSIGCTPRHGPVPLIGSGTLVTGFRPGNPQTTTPIKTDMVQRAFEVGKTRQANLERVQVAVRPHEIDLLQAEITAITHACASSQLTAAFVFDTILDVLETGR